MTVAVFEIILNLFEVSEGLENHMISEPIKKDIVGSLT